jgi:hypothetical protein
MNEMKELIWEIAKASDHDSDLENTELQGIDEPKELSVARTISVGAKANTTNINKFVDKKIAKNVEENGAIKIGETVFNWSKGYKTECNDVKSLINFVTNKKLGDEELENLLAVIGHNFVPKLRGLDAVAERKGMDKQMARDTFIFKNWDSDPKLAVIDTKNSTAPKWAVNLGDGERKLK